MRRWNIPDDQPAGSAMPPGLSLIVHALGIEFATMDDPKPQLVSAGQHDHFGDYARIEALVEMSPGVRLQFGWSSPNPSGQRHEEDGDEQQFVDHIIRHLGELSQHCGPTHVATMLHEAKLRVSRVLGEWQSAKHATRLEDVRLASYPFWLDVRSPKFVLLIEGLDRALRPKIIELNSTEASIERDLEMELAQQVRRRARRAEYWTEGASGSIDRIALNALAYFGDIAEGVRRFAVEERFWLPDDTCVSILDGHVSIGNGIPGADWLWHDDGVTVYKDKEMPDAYLKAAKGRPSTALLEHPFLSEDVLVIDATAENDDSGEWSVIVTLEQPKLLFCANSGRVWAR